MSLQDANLVRVSFFLKSLLAFHVIKIGKEEKIQCQIYLTTYDIVENKEVTIEHMLYFRKTP